MVTQQTAGATAGVVADLSFGSIGNTQNLTYTGLLYGDLGQPVNDGTAVTTQGCQVGGALHVNTIYTPGVHFVYAQFVRCGQYGPAYYNAQLIIEVLPPSPMTTPPCGALLIDPVRSGLVAAISTGNPGALSNTTPAVPPVLVGGAAADGVTQVLVAIPTQNLGDSVTLNLINDANSLSSSSAQDGGLTTIQSNLSNFPVDLANTVPLVASATTILGPTAFAIYQAPTNFARGTQNFPQDNTAVQRQVTLQAICLTNGSQPSVPTNTPLKVVRPPVVLVHGLWSNAKAWQTFKPANPQNQALWGAIGVLQNQSTIYKVAADYSGIVQGITATTPSYLENVSSVSGSALGFSFNAPQVLLQTQAFISGFASSNYVAAVEADLVAHSMGGDIVRAMGALPNFSNQDNYGAGPVDKLITIGTPHLGTPLAGLLLPNAGQDPNSCVREGLGYGAGDYSFQSVTIGSNMPSTVNGAVGDLSALTADPSDLPATGLFPIAYLAGRTNAANVSGLGNTGDGYTLYAVCGLIRRDPLALALDDWNQAVFGEAAMPNALNDGIVPLNSQLNGFGSVTNGNTLLGVIHSPSIANLGFSPPSELDSASGIPDLVINLLNEPRNGSDFH
jgi:pimeloyl-ACP methyl ester carboxylesterase